MATLHRYPVGQKFRRNRSIQHGFQDISIFVFCNFAKNSKIQNGRHFLREIFCLKIGSYSAEIPYGSKISSKSLYLAGFSRYKHFYVLQCLRKIRKFKMAATFGEIKIFFKIEITTLQRYPAGQKFRRNRSIQHGFRDISIFVFCNFCENFENSKCPPFLAREIFFENWEKYSAEISCGSKILSKLLYLARFLRYKHFCVLQFLRKIRKFKMAAIFGETKIFSKLR